jgi:hypothetical protein
MFTNPHISRALTDEHQRDLMAQAGQQRLVRQARAGSAAAEDQQQPRRRLRRAVRTVLRTVLQG